MRKKCIHDETGVTLIETIVALAILGLVAVAFLSGMASASKATIVTNEQTIAESLVRSEIEYVKNLPYEYLATDYDVDPNLSIPDSWTVPLPTVVLVHGSDDGMQEVTVSAIRNGREVLSVAIYKVDR